jgi:hypothetical protein
MATNTPDSFQDWNEEEHPQPLPPPPPRDPVSTKQTPSIYPAVSSADLISITGSKDQHLELFEPVLTLDQAPGVGLQPYLNYLPYSQHVSSKRENQWNTWVT